MRGLHTTDASALVDLTSPARNLTSRQTKAWPSMAALGEDLLGVVNRLQDLVFNTIGNDSLDLPQIVSASPHMPPLYSLLTTP